MLFRSAILSTFNSFLNSAATLFCYDFYKPIFNKNVTDEKLIFVAKVSGTIIAIISMLIAQCFNLDQKEYFYY